MSAQQISRDARAHKHKRHRISLSDQPFPGDAQRKFSEAFTFEPLQP
jgi:hypothetical protein